VARRGRRSCHIARLGPRQFVQFLMLGHSRLRQNRSVPRQPGPSRPTHFGKPTFGSAPAAPFRSLSSGTTRNAAPMPTINPSPHRRASPRSDRTRCSIAPRPRLVSLPLNQPRIGRSIHKNGLETTRGTGARLGSARPDQIFNFKGLFPVFLESDIFGPFLTRVSL